MFLDRAPLVAMREIAPLTTILDYALRQLPNYLERGACQKIGAVGLNSPVMGAPWSGLASLPGPHLSHPDSPVV